MLKFNIEVEKMDYRKLHHDRKKFLRENKRKSFAVIEGENKVILSAPHGVVQTRLGRAKVSEQGSLASVIYLQKKTKSYLIAKTRNYFDDANFEANCEYKDEIDRLATMGKIKYLFDFHELAPSRDCDINLGTNLEQNTNVNTELLDKLIKLFQSNGFIVSCDFPYRGGGNAIAGYIKKRHRDMWTLQVEINSKLTYRKENFEKYMLLLDLFENFINELK